jgi:hypothetical protein
MPVALLAVDCPVSQRRIHSEQGMASATHCNQAQLKNIKPADRVKPRIYWSKFIFFEKTPCKPEFSGYIIRRMPKFNGGGLS